MASLITTTAAPATRGSGAPRLATGALAVALTGAAIWFAWRFATVGVHPLRIVLLLIELSGWTGGLLVAMGLIGAGPPRRSIDADVTYRYAFAVAERVGRTRADDLRLDLRAATDRLLAREPISAADRAMIGALIDGPRRIALVVMLSLCLLVGVAPFAPPPWWAIAAIGVGSVALATSHRIASGGAIRFGDRTRWSFASVGEVVSPTERLDLAPPRWVGTLAAVVALNVCIGLRGISDRWTHGLGDMSVEGRVVAMTWAALVIVGGLYALRTIPTPRLANAHLIARRLEERSARHAALGAAVALGLLGLGAGLAPIDDDIARGTVEDVVEPEISDVGADPGG